MDAVVAACQTDATVDTLKKKGHRVAMTGTPTGVNRGTLVVAWWFGGSSQSTTTVYCYSPAYYYILLPV